MIPSIYMTNIIIALFYEHTQYWASIIHEHIKYYLTNFIQQIMHNTSFSLLVIGWMRESKLTLEKIKGAPFVCWQPNGAHSRFRPGIYAPALEPFYYRDISKRILILLLIVSFLNKKCISGTLTYLALVYFWESSGVGGRASSSSDRLYQVPQKYPVHSPRKRRFFSPHAPHPTHPTPSPSHAPPPHFLVQRVVPICRHMGPYPLPLVHWPRGCSALVFAFVPTAYSWEFFPPNELPSEQSQSRNMGGG